MNKQNLKNTFQRFETKYIVSKDVLTDLLAEFDSYLVEDEHAYSTIHNLYYDTPTFQIIRDTLEQPHFDEKVRIRTYDEYPTEESQVFLEIKKKNHGQVYKRRVATSLSEAEAQIEGEFTKKMDAGLQDELAWIDEHYGSIQPMMYIYYNRYSMKGIENPDIRVTIDHDLVYRHNHLMLSNEYHNDYLLPNDQAIMEIKVPDTCPQWLSQILDKYQVESNSFSKYGVAYQKTAECKGSSHR
ncbi:MAG: polyphosphate polymerase domain-containing protein [Streptococcus sp.]|nr:polyphosphate polymerase domain-containing protein [Streptococcus sp.]